MYTPATKLFLEGYDLSPARADLAQLGELLVRFQGLPWENLTKHLKKAPRGSREVMEDNLRLGAGGTCFSLTNLLRRLCTDLGYHAYPVMADMRHGENIHCALVVELDGKRLLLDPGYLVAEPVSLIEGVAQSVQLPGHRLEYRPIPAGFDLYTVNVRGDETFRYRLRTRAVDKEEFLGHWLASFEDMKGLHLNRLTSEGRLSAHNFNLRVDTGREKRNLKLKRDYPGLVARHFGIDSELAGRALEEWARCRRG